MLRKLRKRTRVLKDPLLLILVLLTALTLLACSARIVAERLTLGS